MQEHKKSYFVEGNLAQTFPHGPISGRSCEEMCGSTLRATWRIKQPSSYTKSQLHALTTINLKKKSWDLLKNCQLFAVQLAYNDCIWHALVHTTFYGQ